MITLKQVLLLWVVAATQAATLAEKKSATQQKRALDYTYPFPIITFQEQPQKFYVETIKSVSPLGQRYLPPTGPTIPDLNGPNNPPISVSFNAFEPAQQSPSPSAKPTPTSAPVVTASAVPAATPSTPVKKRPSGGLGGFKYYGGSGASSSSKTESTASSSTSAPATPTPTTGPKQIKIETAPVSQDKQSGNGKNGGYDYPSPKNSRKPSKKEQKLADSKPEESGIGYQYDVGLPSVIGGDAAASGLSGVSGGSSSGGMGLSYMRQSSPFYSFHVMLD